MDHSNGVPAWLKVMCNAEFFEPCNTHSDIKKNDLNFFCIDCLSSMCSHCLDQHHLEHQYIQIRKYMYKDVINVQDLRKLFSCSGIQTYQTNRAKVVLIKKRPSSQQQNGNGNTSYRCERNLQDPTLYCSIRCKVAVIYEDKAAVMLDENGEREETLKEKEKGETGTSPSKKKQRPNSSKRKGYPVRAPQF